METDAVTSERRGASPAPHQSGDLWTSIHEELRALRSDTGELRAHAENRAHRAEERLYETLATLDQVRQELTEARAQAEANAGERDAYRSRFHRALRERDAARHEAQALTTTTSYRLGHGIVMLLKHPLRTLGAPLHRLRRGTAASRAAATTGSSSTSSGKSGSTGSSGGGSRRREQTYTSVLSATHPVYAYVAFGYSRDALAALARTVRQCAVVGGDHVPLIVTDSPWFTAARPLAVEYIPDRETWASHQDGQDWAELRRHRLAHLWTVHAPARTFFLDPAQPPTLAELLALTGRH